MSGTSRTTVWSECGVCWYACAFQCAASSMSRCRASGDPGDVLKSRFTIYEAHVTTMEQWRLEGPVAGVDVLPFAVAGPLIRDLLEAVSFLYDSGIVHLDMKLDNFFMRSDGGLALGDLGEAKLLVS